MQNEFLFTSEINIKISFIGCCPVKLERIGSFTGFKRVIELETYGLKKAHFPFDYSYNTNFLPLPSPHIYPNAQSAILDSC